jgi:hypothetical protein
MPTVEDQIKHLQGYDPKTPCAMHLWLPDDIKDKALEKGLKPTDEQIADILDSMEHHCDCTLGLTWYTVEAEIDDIEDEVAKASCKEMADGDKCTEECDGCPAYELEPTAEETKAAEECADVCLNEKCLNDDCMQCRMGKVLFGNMAEYRRTEAIKEHRQGVGAGEVCIGHATGETT